jgi:hypothetical protein
MAAQRRGWIMEEREFCMCGVAVKVVDPLVDCTGSRHGVVASGPPGVAAHDPSQTHPAALKESIAFDGLQGVG